MEQFFKRFALSLVLALRVSVKQGQIIDVIDLALVVCESSTHGWLIPHNNLLHIFSLKLFSKIRAPYLNCTILRQ